MKGIILLILPLMCTCASREVVPPAPVLPIPSNSQLAWHRMEMNAFVHFTTNTFTDKEWGFGDESPKLFNPSALNTDQWVKTFKDTGFKGVILTCKHHDGFCLWPSAFTEHSVRNSPWKDGTGDVVKEVAEACKKYGLAFGIYVSPWDRNHKEYGSPAYIDYYRNQLKELFTNYGPLFEMWFDGANGGDGYYGGNREIRSIKGSTYYDWPTTLEYVRTLEPSILFFSDAGPSVRWVGNERGSAGLTNWNTLSPDTLFAGKAGIESLLNTGSENGTAWIPAEVDVSIRPGWFYHAREDSLVKSPAQLFDIYLTSVGRGSTLLLNVPPDRRGLLHETDVRSLRGFRNLLDSAFKTNLAKNAVVHASTYRSNAAQYSPPTLTDEDADTYWATDDQIRTGHVELDLGQLQEVKYIVVQEFISLGQRVKAFSVDVWKNDQWETVFYGTTIGYKRIVHLEPIVTEKVRVNFSDAKASLVISSIEIY